MLKFGYRYKKKLFKEYANENLNLAFGENEFGEVVPQVKEAILEKLKVTNRLHSSAIKVLPYSWAKIFFLPVLILLTGYFAYGSVISDGSIGLSFFAFFVGIIGYICARRIADSPSKVTLGQIVNSKVVLGDNYLEYSYSSLDPKGTEGYKDTNFVVCRMKYSDIIAIQYNEKKNSYRLVGTYNRLSYKNYSVKGEKSYPIEDEIRGKSLEIYDVYQNRDLFAIVSGKVRKNVGLCGTDGKEKLTLALCTLGFGMVGVVDAIIYFILLFRFAFGIAQL